LNVCLKSRRRVYPVQEPASRLTYDGHTDSIVCLFDTFLKERVGIVSLNDSPLVKTGFIELEVKTISSLKDIK